MKHTFFKIRSLVTGLALSATLVLVSLSSSANSNKKQLDPSLNIQPTVEWAGSDATSSLFAISFETGVPVKFEVSMRDADGNVFYSREFESGKFSRYFKLVSETEEISGFTITIRLLPNGETHSFNVSNSVETVSAIAITKE
jgi:hypothetical protein